MFVLKPKSRALIGQNEVHTIDVFFVNAVAVRKLTSLTVGYRGETATVDSRAKPMGFLPWVLFVPAFGKVVAVFSSPRANSLSLGKKARQLKNTIWLIKALDFGLDTNIFTDVS